MFGEQVDLALFFSLLEYILGRWIGDVAFVNTDSSSKVCTLAQQEGQLALYEDGELIFRCVAFVHVPHGCFSRRVLEFCCESFPSNPCNT